MPSYIVKNGTLQLRQNDTHLSPTTYRIIPCKSVHTPTYNDYVNNTIFQLQSQLKKIKQDYYNLISTMWRILSEIDSTPYDQQIMFFNLSTQQIYSQILLIRNLNLPEQEDSSLRLSAIIKVDENSISSPREQLLGDSQRLLGVSTDCYLSQQQLQLQQQQLSPQRSVMRESSLYRIVEEQGEEQNACNLSKIDHPQQYKSPIPSLPMIQRRNSSSTPQTHEPQPQYKHSPPHHLNPSSSQKQQHKQPRRTSFLLKQKISIALHEQQQLRQLLEEQLQKMTQQLDEKNEYLTWTMQQLKIRNQLIQKLKQTIVLRDEALQYIQSCQSSSLSSNQIKGNQHILQQKDKQIGLLINSLIERTDSTYEDFQYLVAKRVQHIERQQNNQDQQYLSEEDEQNNNQVDKTIDIEDLERSVQRSIEEERSPLRSNLSLSKVALSPQIQPPHENQQQSRASSQSASSIDRKDQQQQRMQSSFQALQPKKMNFSSSPSHQPIKYLTKQHFLQAERKTAHHYILANVKMTQSVKMDSSSSSLINTLNYL